jgi:hypothetical protein
VSLGVGDLVIFHRLTRISDYGPGIVVSTKGMNVCEVYWLSRKKIICMQNFLLERVTLS